MKLPDMKQLDSLPHKEVATFWFDYWQEAFPVQDLKLEFSSTGPVRHFAGLAEFDSNTTFFNESVVNSNCWTFHSTARHEHVHHLLHKFGKNPSHTLLFALVDGALELAFEKMRCHSSAIPKHSSIRFYDFHEDRVASKQVNTRLVRALCKRLSRYSNDIETLIDKADKYAHGIRETVPSKIFNFSLLSDRHWDNEERILNQWAESDQIHLAEIGKAREEIATLKEKLSYINSLNMRWQGAFVCLVLAVAWIGSRT